MIVGFIITLIGLSAVFLKMAESSEVSEETALKTARSTPTPTVVEKYEASVTPDPAPASDAADSLSHGEEYYGKGVEYLKKRHYAQALEAFEEARVSGYDADKADKQIRAVKKAIEMQKLYKSAFSYYNSKDYEKAAEALALLAKADPFYKNAPQYADCYFQMSANHNLQGVKYSNEGNLDAAVAEFEAAIKYMQEIRAIVPKYTAKSYERQLSIYSDNLTRTESEL